MSTAVAMPPALPRPASEPLGAPPTPRSLPSKPSPAAKASGARHDALAEPALPLVSTAGPRRDRPCDACRRRKSRCVMHQGAELCVLCELHKQTCTFVEGPLPRKRKASGDRSRDERSKKRSGDMEPLSLALSTPTATNTTPSPGPAQSPVQIPLGETSVWQDDPPSQYIGLSSPFDPLLIGLSRLDSRSESALDQGTLHHVNDSDCFIVLPEAQGHGEVDLFEAIEKIVDPHGPALLDIYFRVVHPSFPIVQKHSFSEQHSSRESRASPALLAGMYVLAFNWWSSDPELEGHAKPDAARLETVATELLFLSMETPKLSTIQAGLLALQRPESSSWSLTTQLVALGQELGLHLDCSSWSIPSWERGLRKRIAWALYMQDKWSSLVHGRPSHIVSVNWAVKPVVEDDFGPVESHGARESKEENCHVQAGRDLFTQMIKLTDIMSKILDTFYTQTAIRDFSSARHSSTRMLLDRAKPIQIKLKEWFARLPPSLRMDARPDDRLSSTGTLHLAYFATEITLHRRIIHSLAPAAPPDAYLAHVCRSAAKTRLISALDFVNRLQPAHLHGFWHAPSRAHFSLIASFGALLCATAPAPDEARFYRLRLLEYRWALAVSAKRAAFMAYALGVLDASRRMLGERADGS